MNISAGETELENQNLGQAREADLIAGMENLMSTNENSAVAGQNQERWMNHGMLGLGRMGDGVAGCNWRSKLVVTNTVREAIEVFPNERFLADSPIRTRSARWKLFAKWARDPSVAHKFRDEFSPLDLCEYMADIADIALDKEDQNEEPGPTIGLVSTKIQKVDDYMSTANQRLIALKIFRNASAGEWRLYANRVALVAGSCTPAKVVPTDSRLISGLLVEKARRLARLWFYGGWRIS